MFIGFLDKRVRVTTLTRVYDGRGGYTTKEVDLGTFWASVQPLGIEERVQYRQLDTTVTTQIYINYNPFLTKDSFIYFKNQKYQVKGIINPGFQNEFMELAVAEV